MRRLLRIVCIAATAAVVASHASAAEKTMPINFVGEWCSPSRDKNTADYTLPSWTPDGHCTDILSIGKYDFRFADKQTSCEPVTLQLGKDTAPSGTAYIATITARCAPDGPRPTAEKLRTFKFNATRAA